MQDPVEAPAPAPETPTAPAVPFVALRDTTIDYLADNAPDARRKGFRFHHFLNAKNGRLVGTIVTAPLEGSPDEQLVACTVASSKDEPSRMWGRFYALWALADPASTCRARMTTDELKAAIFDRSIFERIFELRTGDRASTPSAVRKRRLRARNPNPRIRARPNT